MILDLLLATFPRLQIDRGVFYAREPRFENRVQTEFAVADLFGKTWIDITPQTARGTWDVLDYLSNSCFMMLIAGYLQHLEDPKEADVMISALPPIICDRIKNPHPDQSWTMAEPIRLCLLEIFISLLRHEEYREIDIAPKISELIVLLARGQELPSREIGRRHKCQGE